MQNISRRSWIGSLCGGLGVGRFARHAGAIGRAGGAAWGTIPGPIIAPKAKHVIFLFMTGGPSQLDMFDPKPSLLKYAGQRPPSVDMRTERVTGGLLPSPFAFKKYGQSGIEVSELLPQSGRGHRRHLRDPVDVHLQSHAHARAQSDSLGQHRRDPALHGRLDLLRARVPRMPTCPASSYSVRMRAAVHCGAPASFPPSIRARSSTPRRSSRRR